jgi:hypothetical protein
MEGTGERADAVEGRGCPVAGPEPGGDGLRVAGEVRERPAALGGVLRQADRGLLGPARKTASPNWKPSASTSPRTTPAGTASPQRRRRPSQPARRKRNPSLH